MIQNDANIIFRCIAGSRAYGTARPDSDEDTRGVFVLPQSAYVSLEPPTEQVSDERNDHVLYSLRRFLELATSANPNIIELLFMPDECVLKMTLFWQRLVDSRDIFVTKQVFESHVNYAQAQIKRSRGQNKWVNNPQSEMQPVKEDFCWVIPRDGTSLAMRNMPFRPMPLCQTDVDLDQCHVASLEHCPRTYRLYDYGPAARGVFRNGHLVCESISIDDENARCIGLLIFDEPNYKRACRDHKHYWQWRENRNESRWQSQERGEMDYDAKNMMHTFRLLLSGENILRNGVPLVRFDGEKLDLLKRILVGEFAYETLIAMAEEQVAEMALLHQHSRLPDSPDPAYVDRLLQEVTAEWEAANA